jgi:hypothetical protein
MEPLPAAAVRLLLLHVRRRDGGGRRGNPHSSVGVNDGNGIAGPYRRWLVEFHLRLVVVVLLLMVVRGDGDGRLGHVARRVLKCLCQREWRRHLLHRLNLLLKRRRRGRAGRQGRSVRGRGNRLKIVFRQQPRAELQVIIEIEAFAGLEACSEGRDDGSVGELLHAAHSAELAMGILRREPGPSS